MQCGRSTCPAATEEASSLEVVAYTLRRQSPPRRILAAASHACYAMTTSA